MPRIVDDPGPAERNADTRIDALIALREGFEAGFARSKKGNLWRRWNGVTLTVFARRDGLYGYSIADGDEVRFSPSSYETEQDALGALYDAVAD